MHSTMISVIIYILSSSLSSKLLITGIPNGDDNYDDADNIFDSEVINTSPQGNISKG